MCLCLSLCLSGCLSVFLSASESGQEKRSWSEIGFGFQLIEMVGTSYNMLYVSYHTYVRQTAHRRRGNAHASGTTTVHLLSYSC